MEIHAETMNRFCNQHRIVKHYIEDLPANAIHTRFTPDKRSIHETIAYLCRYQYIFMERLQRITSETNPFFVVYNPEDDPEYQFTSAHTTGALLHEIYRTRDVMRAILTHLTSAQCCRIGTHAVLGRMNVPQWLEFFLLHESHQFYKIFRLAGNFWNNETMQYGSVINMPMMQADEMAG